MLLGSVPRHWYCVCCQIFRNVPRKVLLWPSQYSSKQSPGILLNESPPWSISRWQFHTSTFHTGCESSLAWTQASPRQLASGTEHGPRHSSFTSTLAVREDAPSLANSFHLSLSYNLQSNTGPPVAISARHLQDV